MQICFFYRTAFPSQTFKKIFSKFGDFLKTCGKDVIIFCISYAKYNCLLVKKRLNRPSKDSMPEN